MKEIKNPHNNFFVQFLSDKNAVIEFIKFAFPENLIRKINLDTVKLTKDSFIDEKLRSSYSDLLFECEISGKKGYIYILFEHKSHPEKYTQLQVLGYFLEIWRKDITNGKEMRPIIPVVFYHGKEKWKVFDLKEYFMEIDEDLVEYTPTFKYILNDMSAMEDEKIINSLIKDDRVKATLMLFKHIFDDEVSLEESLRIIFSIGRELFGSAEGVGFIKTFLLYLYNATDVKPEKVEQVIKEVSNKEGVAMSTAEVLEKRGYEKGINEGITQGITQGKIEAARRMYEKGFDEETISEVTGLSIEEIREVLNKE